MPNSVDPILLSYLDALTDAEKARQVEIALVRQFYDGDQDVKMTARLQEFLGLETAVNPFRLNICRTIITSVSERLMISGIDASEEMDTQGIKPTSAWAWNVWKKNKMDGLQSDIHDDALRDGESFVIVDYDPVNKLPRFNPTPRFVDVAQGGDGFGCRMIYPNENQNSDPELAIKEWTEIYRDEDDDKYQSRRRRTLYFDDRIEKYFYGLKGWEPFNEENIPWPIPWVANGKPMGIPVIHFKNKGLRSEIWDLVPIQRSVNKSLLDLLASADLSGFRIYVALGWIPTTDGKKPADDGSNWLKIAPGQIIATPRNKGEVSFDALEGEDVGPLIDVVQQLVLWGAMVTDTPATRFITSKVLASGETLKEQQEPLDAKVDNRKSLFGDAWMSCFYMARKLENRFGGGTLNEETELTIMWIKRYGSEAVASKMEIEVPVDQLWVELGYTPYQVQQMQKSPEYQKKEFETAQAFWQAVKAAKEVGYLNVFLTSQGWTPEMISALDIPTEIGETEETEETEELEDVDAESGEEDEDALQ